MASTQNTIPRIDWVDFAKGMTIILVVQMHVTAGIEASLGTESTLMHALVDFFRAFRMPLFFLVAGLFLQRSIDKPWMEYLDKKVIHFAYFYFLWIFITFVIKYPLADASTTAHNFSVERLLWSVIEPFGTLWFIYILAVFYIVTRLLNSVLPMPAVLAIGVALYLWQPNPTLPFLPDGHSMLIKEFGWRYIFFLSGFYGYNLWFKLADHASKAPLVAIAAFAIFSFGNILFLSAHFPYNHPLALLNSYAGALATIALCAVFARYNIGTFLSFIGKHSLYIYISFFVPNAFLRTVMIKLEVAPPIDQFILLVLVVCIITPIIAFHLLKKTPLAFFYSRPKAFQLRKNSDATLLALRIKQLQ